MMDVKTQRRIDFLRDLALLLDKHNVTIDVTSRPVGYNGHEVELEFDLDMKDDLGYDYIDIGLYVDVDTIQEAINAEIEKVNS